MSDLLMRTSPTFCVPVCPTLVKHVAYLSHKYDAFSSCLLVSA